MKVNTRINYKGAEYLVSDIGDDGSLALTPVIASGPSQHTPGDLELSCTEAKNVTIICNY